MDVRRELLLTVGALVLLNLFLAFESIGLFLRMGPAIQRILDENVFSIVAAEEMLVEMAGARGHALSDPRQDRIRDAFERARSNITEIDERPIMSALEVHLPSALAGDDDAQSAVVRELDALIRINHSAMARVDHEAQRLGNAGAWAAVLVGFLSFLLSLLVLSHLRKRLLRPLEELHAVLEAVRGGDHLRRCHAADAPVELLQLMQSVNRLLDERLTGQVKPRSADEELERVALVDILEKRVGTAALVDSNGRIVRATVSMLEKLAGAGGDAIREGMLGQPTSAVLERFDLRGRGSLVVLKEGQ